MKYSQWIGVAASLILVAACFLPWTYHPDLNKEFTGFFSENNVYGRPGRVFIFFAAVAIIFPHSPRVGQAMEPAGECAHHRVCYPQLSHVCRLLPRHLPRKKSGSLDDAGLRWRDVGYVVAARPES